MTFRQKPPILPYGVDQKQKGTGAADVWWSLLGAYGVLIAAVGITAALFWLGF